MEPITYPQSFRLAILRLALAAFCGAAIGLNRELRHKPAGLRTHSLVALGTSLVALIGLSLANAGDMASASRVIQGLVAGIGFIGAGVILHRDDSKGVHGLTTAASIWVVSAIGIAAGLGLWRTGLAVLALVLMILILGRLCDRFLRHRDKSSQGEDV